MTTTQQRTTPQQPVRTGASTARQLDRVAPWQPLIDPEHRARPAGKEPARQRPRTPLALAPSPARTSGKGFVSLCVGILVAALLTVLVVTITVSNRQYDMVGLKGEQLELTQSNERLRQQVEHLQAPQNVAAEAASLGMVMPGHVAAIDLSTGEVSGVATAAEGEDQPTDLVDAPGRPGESAAAEGDQPAERAAAHSRTDQASDAAATDPAPQGSADDSAAQPAESELNGGTIPAPQFSTGG